MRQTGLLLSAAGELLPKTKPANSHRQAVVIWFAKTFFIFMKSSSALEQTRLGRWPA
jgi:hypothetical protein